LLRETQTLRAGCSKLQQKFRPAAVRLPGGAGRPKFNQLEMVTTFINNPNLINVHNFDLSCDPQTNKHRHKTHKQTGPITKHCTAASAQCNEMNIL